MNGHIKRKGFLMFLIGQFSLQDIMVNCHPFLYALFGQNKYPVYRFIIAYRSMMSRSGPQKEDLRKLGVNAFKERDFIKSLGYFSLALEHTPDDVQLLEWKLKCFYELKELQICLKYITDSEISSAGMMLIESKIYLELHDFAKIAEYVQKSSNMQNESKLKTSIEDMMVINAIYNKYLTSKSESRFKQAAECLNELIGKLPLNENTITLRIEQLQCLINCGELEKAKIIFESVQQQSQKTLFLFCLRLRLYYYLRDQAKYKQLVQRGQTLFVNDNPFRQIEKMINETEFTLKQGKLLLQYKKYSESIKVFVSGIGLDPLNKLANAIFYFNLAIVYMKLFMKDQALLNFSKSIGLNPFDVIVRREKAQFNIQCKEYISAILEYERLLDIDPENSQYYQKEIRHLQKLDKRNGKQNFYQILNIKKGAQEEEIKKAYKMLAMKYHPDRNRNKSASEIAESSYIFMQITQAYKSLMDPEFRKNYDTSLTSFEYSEEQDSLSQEGSQDRSNPSNHSAGKEQASYQRAESSESSRRSRDKFKNKHNYEREADYNRDGRKARGNHPNRYSFYQYDNTNQTNNRNSQGQTKYYNQKCNRFGNKERSY